MKAYTDINQSKKLAEILPLESADMYYCYGMDIHTKGWSFDDTPTIIDNSNRIDVHVDIPCWSLAALINIIKPINENTYTIRGTLDGGATISFDEVTNVMFQEKEIIDAVFEMVVWLKKNRKI